MAISKSPTIKEMDKGTSAPQDTSVGTGSRPGTTSKYPIPTSAPDQPHTLGRETPGWLK